MLDPLDLDPKVSYLRNASPSLRHYKMGLSLIVGVDPFKI